MQYININTHRSFFESESFFQYHGLILSILWIVACSLGIFLKKINVYLHAIAFFLIDVITIYFVAGAWVKLYPQIQFFNQWSTLKQVHVLGGTVFAVLLICQHLLGVKTLMSKLKKSRTHVILAWLITNFARIITYLGWTLGHYKNKQDMKNYVLYSSIFLLIISTGSVFFGWGKSKSKVGEGSATKVPIRRKDQ